jgi:lysophospholipase L1-like esterase
MKIHSVFMLLSFLVTACMSLTDSSNIPAQDPLFQQGKYRYLALGDSYTIGESVPPEQRWSVVLADLLRQKNVDIATPEIIARTGWTTAELADGIAQRNPQGPYQLVSLLIGVNNQYRGQSLERYRTELQALLRLSISYAGGRGERVLMLSIPDWGVSPFAQGRDLDKIAREIDAFNQVAQEECKKLGVAYVDITPLSRKAKGDASLIANDKLHFSGKMYRQWAETALPTVQQMLGK